MNRVRRASIHSTAWRRHRDRSTSLATRNALRQGYSLIELVVVMSMLSVLLALTGTTFYFLMRSEKSVTQSLVTERSVSRLANQFRDDVHQSIRCEQAGGVGEKKTELTLKTDDQHQVQYRTTKGGLTRYQVEAGNAVAREDYRLPECEIHFESDGESNPTLCTLVIQRPGAVMMRTPRGAIPLRALKIQARVMNQGVVVAAKQAAANSASAIVSGTDTATLKTNVSQSVANDAVTEQSAEGKGESK